MILKTTKYTGARMEKCKPFPFLSLPKELRLEVYEHLTTTPNYMRIPAKDGSFVFTYLTVDSGLLETNRQVSAEAKAIIRAKQLELQSQICSTAPIVYVSKEHKIKTPHEPRRSYTPWKTKDYSVTDIIDDILSIVWNGIFTEPGTLLPVSLNRHPGIQSLDVLDAIALSRFLRQLRMYIIHALRTATPYAEVPEDFQKFGSLKAMRHYRAIMRRPAPWYADDVVWGGGRRTNWLMDNICLYGILEEIELVHLNNRTVLIRFLPETMRRKGSGEGDNAKVGIEGD